MYKIIGSDQKQYGPVSANDLRQWIAEGRVNAQTLLQAEGQTEWRPLSSFPEFASAAAPTPSGTPLMSGASASPNVEAMVNAPAITILVVAILYALACVLGILSSLLGWGANAFGQGAAGNANLPPELVKILQSTGGMVGVVFAVVQLALSGFYILAATKMRKLESYGLVMTATIMFMLPCVTPSCCCIIGLPIGIWSLVVLNKPEVKEAFH